MKKLMACAVIAVLPLAACDQDSGNWPVDTATDLGGDVPADTGPDISVDVPTDTPAPDTATDTGGPDTSGGCTTDLGTWTPSEVLAGNFSSICSDDQLELRTNVPPSLIPSSTS